MWYSRLMLLDRALSCLVVVDVQARLLPAMAEPERVVRGVAALIGAALRLNVGVLATEQYAKGIGRTVPELAGLLPEDSFVEKIHFSAAAEPAFNERLAATGRRQAVVCGIEAHVCVLQTALGLKAQGYDTVVVADAVSSRAPANRDAALARMQRHGVSAVTAEMVIFEWLGRADTPEFREMLPVIKALA